MADNVGITTRLQAKKMRELLGRHGKGEKRRSSSREVLAYIDEENLATVNSTLPAVHNRRSFPPDPESDPWARDGKKTAKTDSSAKQKSTLSERSENTALKRQFAYAKAGQGGHTKCQYSSLQYSDQMMVEETRHDCHDSSGPSSLMDSEPVVDQTVMSPGQPAIPADVVDIDAYPDSLTTTVYSPDIMEYLQQRETLGVIHPDFLNNSPEVTSTMRGILMDWLLQVQAHEELNEETLHLCISLIDRFMATNEINTTQLQLVGVTCLLIASKFCERFAPEVSILCYLTDNTFTKDQVLTLERFALYSLRFEITFPVCVTFLQRYLQADGHHPQVEHLAQYLLDLSITTVKLVPTLPSLKSASALYLARLLLLDTPNPWSPTLMFYTGYSKDELQNTARELALLLLKAPDSKFQGARMKYNCKKRCFISYARQVGTESVLSKFFGKVSSSPDNRTYSGLMHGCAK